MTERSKHPLLRATDFQVLLALWEGPLYGYAIKKAVTEESGGTVSPQIGSLYRVLARLMSHGLVEETNPPKKAVDVYPGNERRYYRLTTLGRAAARAEATRLDKLMSLARHRDLIPQGERS